MNTYKITYTDKVVYKDFASYKEAEAFCMAEDDHCLAWDFADLKLYCQDYTIDANFEVKVGTLMVLADSITHAEEIMKTVACYQPGVRIKEFRGSWEQAGVVYGREVVVQ